MTSSMVLRKRSRGQREGLVLHLSSPPPNCDLYSGSEYEPEVIPRSPVASTSSGKRAKTPNTNGGYICGFEGCNKVYTKPSRLAEHQRSHTGEVSNNSTFHYSMPRTQSGTKRPYVCTVCSKTYLRESHLQAHARSHQPESSKPFVCEAPECGKRFWTTQHLRVHSELHQGEKPFKVTNIKIRSSGPPDASCWHSVRNPGVTRHIRSIINLGSTSVTYTPHLEQNPIGVNALDVQSRLQPIKNYELTSRPMTVRRSY